MNDSGSVAVCGAITGYNATEPPKGTIVCYNDYFTLIVHHESQLH